MNLVIVGIQGSGKGTQARKIIEKNGATFFEMGQKLRNFSEIDHPLAPRVKECLTSGALVPEEIVEAMLLHFKENHAGRAIVFDGIPRTQDQKALFDRVFQDYFIIFLDLSKDEALKRLAGRKIDPENGESFPADFRGDFSPYTGNRLIKRPDDTPEAAGKRIETFYQNTLPLLASWASDGKRVYRVDASKPIDEVFAHIEVILTAYAN